MTDSHANFTYRGHTTEWNNMSTFQGVTVQNDVTAQYQSYWGTPFSVLDDSVKPFMFKPNVINMFAYYRHCAWQLQWLNWWVFHNDVNAPLVLLHKSDNIKVYHPDLHSLKYCVSTVRTHHFLCWLWMAVDEHLVRSRKRGSSEECWAAHTRDRVTE